MTSAIQSYCGGRPPVFWTAQSRGAATPRDFPKMQRESGHWRIAPLAETGGKAPAPRCLASRLMPSPLTALTCGAKDELPLANSTMRVRLDMLLRSDRERYESRPAEGSRPSISTLSFD
jgi:hypothetical protein